MFLIKLQASRPETLLKRESNPENIAKLLRTPILKNICERLLLPLEVLCRDFVDITFLNASFRILEDAAWLQVTYF